jgi:hypothetical protein
MRRGSPARATRDGEGVGDPIGLGLVVGEGEGLAGSGTAGSSDAVGTVLSVVGAMPDAVGPEQAVDTTAIKSKPMAMGRTPK